MKPITFTVVGIPQSKGSMRAFMPRGVRFPIMTSTNPKGKAWEKAVGLGAMAARGAGVKPELGAVEVSIAFYLPRPQAMRILCPHIKRPDLDKLLRCAIDGMTGILWKDDSQVVRISATKAYADFGQSPRATITVRPVEVALFHSLHTQTEAVQ
jgi:crossover junction endodeoxyribonuclease RusA